MGNLRNNDIFNPEYAKKKPFFTKKKVKMLFYIFIIICLIGYGAKEYLVKNTVKIEIRNAKNKKIDEILLSLKGNETVPVVYTICNKSPYPIILNISLIGNGTLDYITNYDDTIIGINKVIIVWLSISNNSTRQSICRIELDGIKA